MRIVVCDAGPVLHLSEAGALGLLEKAGQVFIPTAVDQEVARHIADWPARRPGWIQVEPPPNPAPGQLAQWAAQIDIGAGEMEAIVLARSLAVDWLLTDDAAARVVATLLGIEVHGSLGVVLWAAAERQIKHQEAAAILERLAKSSLWGKPCHPRGGAAGARRVGRVGCSGARGSRIRRARTWARPRRCTVRWT